MTVHLCSCGFVTDDPGWLDGHLFQHPGHHQRDMAPHGAGRLPAVSALTTGELERTRRDLTASLALSRPGSPARVPITTQLAAIDAELADRNSQQL